MILGLGFRGLGFKTLGFKEGGFGFRFQGLGFALNPSNPKTLNPQV